ncbi:MAG: hypothetical protein HUJ66_06235, partial [Oscillospiraceae bacterium]|nr:hypothetical protein [Oscillospiraceae bacterium]
MEESKFLRNLYRKFAVANLIANTLSFSCQIINSIIVGQFLGAEALSVISVCSPLTFVFLTITGTVIIGGVLLSTFYTGECKLKESGEVFTSCLILASVICLAVAAVLLIFREPIIHALCPDETLLSGVRKYYTIFVIGGTGYAVSFIGTPGFLQKDGKPVESTLAYIVGTTVSTVLCYVLVSTGTMGVEGAALATVMGSFTSGVIGAVIILRKGSTIRFTRVKVSLILSFAKKIFTLGSNAGLENASFMLRSLAINAILASCFGSMSLAAFGVIGSVLNIFNAIAYSVSTVGNHFFGVFIAERDYTSAKRMMFVMLKRIAVIGICVTLLFVVFSRQIAAVFGMSTPEEIAAVAPAVAIFSLCLLPLLINFATSTLHMANKRIALANLTLVCRLFAFVVLFALILKGPFGVKGVWHSFWLSETLALVMALVIQFFISRKNPELSPLTLLYKTGEEGVPSMSVPVNCSKAEISRLCVDAKAFCETNGISSRRCNYLCLAIEEILISLRYHALEKDDESVADVFVAYRDDDLFLRVRTAGKPFNPIAYARMHKSVKEAYYNDEVTAITVAAVLDACKEV